MVRRSLHHNVPGLTALAGYLVLALILSGLYGFELDLTVYSFLLVAFTGAVATVAFTIAGLGILLVERPKRPLALLWSRARGRYRLGERIAVALPVMLALPPFFSAFTSVKRAIPTINPNGWDRAFMEIDAALHGGTAPWELLQPLAHPLATFAISFAYNLWLPVAWAVLIVMAFVVARPVLRSQYLIAFVVSWTALGTAGAIVFASMGPCFYDLAHPDDINPFAPLVAYLAEVNETYPVWALGVQEMLRADHLAGRTGFGAGISAFPSMHVAIAVLNAILGWQLSRLAGWLLTSFAVVIMIGSVHLGWHYAVDGYASALAVPVIWKLSGAIAAYWHRRAHPAAIAKAA